MASKDIIRSTSFSRLQDFRRCKLYAKYRYIDRIPDPAPPPPEGKERPMDRGTRIHNLAEGYVSNPLMKLPEELECFSKQLDSLRKGYSKGRVALEYKIAFDKKWRRVPSDDFDRAVYRAVLDVLIKVSRTKVIIIDYKTGKRDGNEIKHHEQCMEYAVCVALLAPSVQLFNTQLWYPDHELIYKKTFTRSQVLRAFKSMKEKHREVLSTRVFPAEPSKYACFFCPYKAGTVGRGVLAYPGTGHCRKNVC